MPIVLVIVGATLVLITLIDVGATTLPTSAHGGPITSPLAKGLWSLPPRRSAGGGHHEALHAASLVIVTAVIVAWLVLLWAGWSLLFLSQDGAVVEAASENPAGGWARVYYAGFSAFSLGTGDYQPNGAVWQLASVVSVLTGLSVLTLAVTYVLGVVTAETHKRQVASAIAAMGPTPAAVLRRGWDGHSLRPLDEHLRIIGPELSRLAQQHFAYPVLHYLHSSNVETAVPPNVARLGEVVGIVRCELPDAGVSTLTLEAAESAIWALLETRKHLDVRPFEEDPDTPDLASVQAAGIPISEEWPRQAGEADTAMRQRLLRLVHSDGWAWNATVTRRTETE